jgi:hypothetical protein
MKETSERKNREEKIKIWSDSTLEAYTYRIQYLINLYFYYFKLIYDVLLRLVKYLITVMVCKAKGQFNTFNNYAPKIFIMIFFLYTINGEKKGYGGEFNYKIVMYTVCAIYNPTTCRGENKEVYKIKKKKT